MDPYALNADGSAADPAAFQATLRQDSAKLEQLQQDPELEATLLGDDTDKLQQLLRSVFEEELQRRKNRGRFMAERSIDAQRASATVPRDTVQLYQQLHASGLQYGPAFRLLRNVHVPDVSSGRV